MLDCLNDDELHTLYGYLQRIIDASSDGVPASTAEDAKKRALLIEHPKRRHMTADPRIIREQPTQLCGHANDGRAIVQSFSYKVIQPHDHPAPLTSTSNSPFTRHFAPKPYFKMRHFAPKPHFEMRHFAHTRQKMLPS